MGFGSLLLTILVAVPTILFIRFASTRVLIATIVMGVLALAVWRFLSLETPTGFWACQQQPAPPGCKPIPINPD